MGGLGGCPIDQNLGLVMAERSSLPQTRWQVFTYILNFWPLFAWKLTKSFQLQGAFHLTLHQGLCPWAPLGARPPSNQIKSNQDLYSAICSRRFRGAWTPFRLALRALAMPPLANPGSATVSLLMKNRLYYSPRMKHNRTIKLQPQKRLHTYRMSKKTGLYSRADNVWTNRVCIMSAVVSL